MTSYADDLRKQFHAASRRFPFLRHAAATHHGELPKWPLGGGIPDHLWKPLLQKQPGEFFAPFSKHWLRIGNRQWEGVFFNGGDASQLSIEESQALCKKLKKAINKFEELGGMAAGNFPVPPSPHYLADFPLEAKSWHRWLEVLYTMPFVENPEDREAFLVRRLPGDVFAASARAIETLDAEQSERTGDGPRLPCSIEEIPDANLRWQTGRTWRAATDLLDCIEWFLCLIEQLETGAEVSLPEWEKQYEKAGRAGNTLCDAGAVPEDVTPIKIIAAFPEPPNPVAGWQKQYDVDRARVKKSPLSDLARQLNAIRIQAETCPMTLLMPTATNTEQDEENGRIGFPIPPHLNGRDREVLKVLLDGEAFDSDHLMRTADIALKAAGKAADPNQYKEVIVKLKTLGYVETKEGRGGGCWLTAPGRQRAEKL